MAILATLKFEFLHIFAIFRAKIYQKPEFKASKVVKMAAFQPLKMSTLISRKIWVAEKLLNFHTLWLQG